MKKIKIKILGHIPNNTFLYSHYILTTLQKYYEVELSDTPEYLFYHDTAYEHYLYDGCIKIFYTGENISPNFNQCDYAISFDYLNFEDRHYRMPLYLVSSFYSNEEKRVAGDRYLQESARLSQEELTTKKEFCSFVYSNYRAEHQRKMIFEALSNYKRVTSGGGYLNNTDNKKIKNKLEFEMKHKFSIAFENSSRSGYTTEKIVGSIAAKTIPIYWGNPNIAREFNTRRFINCHDYDSFDQVVEKVKELDANDELYLKMVNEPIAADNYNFEEVRLGFDTFLKKIIDQPLKKAERRTINPVKALEVQRFGKLIAQDIQRRSLRLKIMARLYQPFKKITFLEKIKHNYFKKVA